MELWYSNEIISPEYVELLTSHLSVAFSTWGIGGKLFSIDYLYSIRCIPGRDWRHITTPCLVIGIRILGQTIGHWHAYGENHLGYSNSPHICTNWVGGIYSMAMRSDHYARKGNGGKKTTPQKSCCKYFIELVSPESIWKVLIASSHHLFITLKYTWLMVYGIDGKIKYILQHLG